MPTKIKTKKVATMVTKKKGKALKRKSQPPNVQSDMEWTTQDDEDPSLELMMTNMGTLLSTLNTRMEGFARRQDHMEGTAVSHTVYTTPPVVSTGQDAEVQAPLPRLTIAEMHAPLPDMADVVKAQVAQRLWGAPAPYHLTDEDTASEDEGTAHPSRRRAMKSGKVCTTDTYVTKRERWPHEMVFTTQEQSTVYSDMSIALFTNGGPLDTTAPPYQLHFHQSCHPLEGTWVWGF